MKRAYIPALLIWFISVNLFSQQAGSLSYRIEPGEDFHFKVSSKNQTDTTYTSQLWLQFSVLGMKEEYYEMAVSHRRIYQNINSQTFDSQDYFSNTTGDITDIINRIAIDKQILFRLSKQGEIDDIRFSDELKTAIETNVLGIRNKSLLKNFSLLSDYRIKSIIRNVFPILANTKEWTEQQPGRNNYPEYEMSYRLEAPTAEHLIIRTKVDFENTDPNNFSSGKNLQIRTDKISHDGIIYLDSANGLLSHYQSKDRLKFTTRLEQTPDEQNSIDTESNTIIERVEQHQFGQLTYIKGTLSDKARWGKLRFYVWHDFPDSGLLDITVSPEGDQFSAQFFLQRPTELKVVGESDAGSLGNFGNLLLEPGDSLEVNLSYVRGIEFGGKGAAKNQVWHQMQELGLNLSKDMSLSEVNRVFRKNLKQRTKLLEAARPDISDWAFSHLHTDIYFREQRNRFNYYKGNTGLQPDLELFLKLFGDLDFKTHKTSLPYEFRWFAQDYLKARANIFHNYERDRLVPSSDLYALARMMLHGEQEYFVKAQIIADLMKLGKAQDYAPLYADFVSTYPGSPLANSLKKTYINRGNLALGQKAPDFTLTSLDGQRFRLSQKRGKWVMLVFYDLNEEKLADDVAKFARLSKEIPDEDFELIVAFTHQESHKTQAYLQGIDYKATFLNNSGWSNPQTQPYNLPYIPKNYLINPEGRLEFIGGLNSWDLYLDEFEEYIKQDMRMRHQLEGNTDSLPPVWVFLAMVALLGGIWLYQYLKAVNQKKKELQKLEKVEIEIKAVRSQLNPHFIFNAMSSIQHLVNARDHENANLFLSKFATLMRKVLNQSDLQLLSLAQELETLNDYLDLEALRHGFEFEMKIADNVDIYQIDIPPMLLQPFVENAVVHGISQINEDGKILIDISQNSEEAISIKIIDNGLGLNQATKPVQANGKGLDLTKRRLALIMEKFKNEISFVLGDRKDFDGQRGAFAEIIVGLED